jgi:hypothetical protein
MVVRRSFLAAPLWRRTAPPGRAEHRRARTDADERIARLSFLLDNVIAGQEEAQRLPVELGDKLAEEQRLREEEPRRREEAERALAEARAESERLRKGAT